MELHNYHDWIAERQQLLERIKELEAENAELKKRLGEDVELVAQEPTAMQTLSLQKKIAMYSMKITHVISSASRTQRLPPACSKHFIKTHKCDFLQLLVSEKL